MLCYFCKFNISSAEQSSTAHNLEKVASVGCALPERYCEIVALETPIALAISLFFKPDCSISLFKFSVIIKSKLLFIIQLY